MARGERLLAHTPPRRAISCSCMAGVCEVVAGIRAELAACILRDYLLTSHVLAWSGCECLEAANIVAVSSGDVRGSPVSWDRELFLACMELAYWPVWVGVVPFTRLVTEFVMRV